MTFARSPVMPNTTNTSAGCRPSSRLGLAAVCARRLGVVAIRLLPFAVVSCEWNSTLHSGPSPQPDEIPGAPAITVVAMDPRIVELEAPGDELVARFATGAGMVGCSLRHRGEELLGLGRGLEAYVREGKVFGIPILYPWANRLGGWGYEAAGRRVVLDRSSPL